MTSPALNKELVILILQFLEEEKYIDAVHRLERESGVYFNLKYFEDCVKNGEWEKVEEYLSGFTKPEDNKFSTKIYFEIRKQKYLEALDRHDHAKAVEILVTELKMFSSHDENLFKDITMLLTLKNFRENEQLSNFGKVESARSIMFQELKKLIEANPLLSDKLQLPTLKKCWLRALINQSLIWQHQQCKNSIPNPDIGTLFTDHTCGMSDGAHVSSSLANPLISSISRVSSLLPLDSHAPCQSIPGRINLLSGTVPDRTASVGINLLSGTVPDRTASVGRTGLATPSDIDSGNGLKRLRPFGATYEANGNISRPLAVAYHSQIHAHARYSTDDLPRNVVVNINQGSPVKSLEFHPVQQTLLLVGSSDGDVTIWEVGSRERLAFQNFKVWNLGACSVNLQACIADELTASVNRVTWSPDGAHFGVAYSKNIVHVYSYHGGSDLRNQLEIDAHIGNVGDVAFSHPKKRLCIITCGEDKMIKVWDCITRAKLFTFEGHAAPLFSVYPHQKEHIQFFFSTSVDGKIKAWLYDDMCPKVVYDAPGCSCTRMVYNTDGTRLFSCGTNERGESYLVEWNETEGSVKRTYEGLGKNNVGVVQFDTTRNRFLAAGDEFQIKFWDMENSKLLMATNADGDLPANPCIKFNKEGMLLAVSTKENGIKVLANSDGARLLRSIESHAEASMVASAAVTKGRPLIGEVRASCSTNGLSAGIGDRNGAMEGAIMQNGHGWSQSNGKPGFVDGSEKFKLLKFSEINEPSELHSMLLPDTLPGAKVSSIAYTNAGVALLGLDCNAVHKLWKWSRNDRNLLGKASSSVAPQLYQPSNGVLMTNSKSETNAEDAVPCFALSKNDSYVISSSGGKIFLYNMLTFKTLTTFMSPPPAATSIAFNPQDNNILAIGMDDSSIEIYNVRLDKVINKLKGHEKRVTGLTFSDALNVLVSSGADAQLCVWTTVGWLKQSSKYLQTPASHELTHLSHTRVHFDQDQIHVLAVHKTQLAIYKAPSLDLQKQWIPEAASGSILDAVFSCDGQLMYACLEDGSLAVLTVMTLQLSCRISPAAFISSCPSSRAYPVVVTAHPTEPNQFAVGLTDGRVYVLEPLESEKKWGDSPPPESTAGPSASSSCGSDR